MSPNHSNHSSVLTTLTTISQESLLQLLEATRSVHEDPVLRLLIYSKQSLARDLLPLRLRAISYVRMVCCAMRKTGQIRAGELSYLPLLQSLIACDRQWWKQCEIDSDGYLQSHNVEIDQLLQLLAQFARQYEVEYQQRSVSNWMVAC